LKKTLAAEVAVPLPIEQTLTYQVPDHLEALVKVGSRVVVEVKRKIVTGCVLDLERRAEGRKLKAVRDAVDSVPVLTPDLIRLGRWIADYYVAPLGEVLAAMSPPSPRLRRIYALARAVGDLEMEILRATSPAKASVISVLAAGKACDIAALRRKSGSSIPADCLTALVAEGLVGVTIVPTRRRSTRSLEADGASPLPGQPGHSAAAGGDPPGVASGKDARAAGASATPRLTSEQEAALGGIRGALDSGEFGVSLLLGVTGSGKTEVYLRAIDEALSRGKRAIYLVPEIALTPQIMARVRERYGDRCAVLHSRLSDGERYGAWLKILFGGVDVVVGARSAVFAPLARLGIIVVDEEHEASYKQQDSPRYNAREVAIMRAKHARAVAVLGSATPAVETYHNALAGKYALYELSERIAGGGLPEVAIVDMRTPGARAPLSEDAEREIAGALGRGEQVVLFLNRRGFSNYVQCLDCGFVPRCRNCNVTLTYHLKDRRLVCHYCDYAEEGWNACPRCGRTRVEYVGSGTQKIEDMILKAFPGATCARFDKDTTRRQGSTEELLNDFASGMVRMLVGTQMLAKGHDFRSVGLVVVVNADVTMNLPDFRSGERTFQIVTQVAGRAGRGEVPGRVIVQTFNPDHHALAHAVAHDFKGFFGEELGEREALRYPPFARLVRVVFEARREAGARKAAKDFRSIALRLAKTARGRTEVMGPSRAPVSRVKNVHRWHLLVKGERGTALSGFIRRCKAELERAGLEGVRMAVDVDPQAML
jgi:primosomal protein N' (replication factor Y)